MRNLTRIAIIYAIATPIFVGAILARDHATGSVLEAFAGAVYAAGLADIELAILGRLTVQLKPGAKPQRRSMMATAEALGIPEAALWSVVEVMAPKLKGVVTIAPGGRTQAEVTLHPQPYWSRVVRLWVLPDAVTGLAHAGGDLCAPSRFAFARLLAATGGNPNVLVTTAVGTINFDVLRRLRMSWPRPTELTDHAMADMRAWTLADGHWLRRRGEADDFVAPATRDANEFLERISPTKKEAR